MFTHTSRALFTNGTPSTNLEEASSKTVRVCPLTAAEEHTYAMASGSGRAGMEASQRTRKVTFDVTNEDSNKPRDPATVDDKFLSRAKCHLFEALRPLDCLIGASDYRENCKASAEGFADLSILTQYFGLIKVKIEEFQGVHIPLSWPNGKTLRLTPGVQIGYNRVMLEALELRYLQCGQRLEVLGVVLGHGESVLSDHRRPVVLICSTGGIFAHVPAIPIWNEDYDPVDPGERMFVIAESLQSLAKEGLVRCDFAYSEEGGAPLACPGGPDGILDEVLKLSGKCKARQLIQMLRNIQGYTFYINGCPGMLRDRVFIVSHDAPSYVTETMRVKSSVVLHVIGRIALTPDDPVTECDLYVALCLRGKVYGFEPSTCSLRLLAENMDMFFRIGSRRWHFNFRLSPNGISLPLEGTTFRPNVESGFCMIPKELTVVRVRIVHKDSELDEKASTSKN